MTRFGLDSTGEVSPAAHHAVGSTVALRYLSRFTPKVITRSEYLDYRRNGIDLVLVFEDNADNALRGHAAGLADAEFALKQAVGILGHPQMPLVVRWAADYDPSGRVSASDPYAEAWNQVFHRENTGPYGGYDLARYRADHGDRMIWQTYAWSRGLFERRSSCFQYSNGHVVGGVGVDYNKCIGEDFGQFNRRQPVPPDPYHYHWYLTGPFSWGKFRHMNERAIVMRYDHLRETQTHLKHPHRKELDYRKAQCGALAVRLAWLIAHGSGVPFHRRERFKGLAARGQGKRLTK